MLISTSRDNQKLGDSDMILATSWQDSRAQTLRVSPSECKDHLLPVPLPLPTHHAQWLSALCFLDYLLYTQSSI